MVYNPILSYCEWIIFPAVGKIEIKRKEDNGGNVLYEKYEVLLKDFEEGKLHPGDLKPAVAGAINALI